MLITKGTTSDIALTLQEKVTLDDPTFLFVFTSDSTSVDYAVILADTSTPGAQRDRANQFTLTEGVSDPTNGSVILGRPGMYTYKVYEQSSTTNLDPDNATGIVERGEMRLIGSSEASDFVEHQIEVTYVEHSVV